MISKNQKLDEINNLMNNSNLDVAMKTEVLELTEIVDAIESSKKFHNEDLKISKIFEKSLQNNDFTSNNDDEINNNLKELGINSSVRSVVDLVVKSEIRKWLNSYLAKIVRDEVKRAIENIISNNSKQL